jgi:hypothetical protein
MEDWNRLADYVIAGRVRAGFANRRAFVAHLDRVGAPVTERTLGTLERGERVSMDTVAAVEIGLSWAPGSGRATLTGGEPKTKASAPSPSVERAEVPPYIDLDRAEDWEAEIWEKLLLLTPHEKGLIIGVLKGVRGQAAQAADPMQDHATTRRRTG